MAAKELELSLPTPGLDVLFSGLTACADSI